ncbi:hypothetical protein BJY52DRAFT_1324308 [Lactarius psammicola]|nr:hypothetical protein BJY52DRAFT_1324308 [Lactarius psammicola]
MASRDALGLVGIIASATTRADGTIRRACSILGTRRRHHRLYRAPLRPRPPLQIVGSVIDCNHQAIESPCFLHECKFAQCVYGDPNGVMMIIGCSSSACFDPTQLPMHYKYYCVNFLRAQELPREVDPLSASFCRNVCDCGALFRTPVEEVQVEFKGMTL